MSTNKKNWTDGEALTTTELQRAASVAAVGDDRAWEGVFTPGSTQKKIVPLSEETATVNPRLLVVPGATSGAAKLQPCLLIAGGSGLPNHINLAAKLETALDAAQFASNSSGGTRFDLIYATIAYATSVTGSRKVKDVTSGVVSTQPLTLEKAPAITLTVLPNVGNVTPLATMPADAVDGSSYNFPLALVAVANGFTLGTAIAQTSITQMWNGGWVHAHRVKGLKTPSMFVTGSPPTEKPTTPISDRWAGSYRMVVPVKNLSTTGGSGSNGAIIDGPSSGGIDWRNRIIWGQGYYLGSAGNAIETLTTAVSGGILPSAAQTAYLSGAGGNGAPHGPQASYNAGANIVNLQVDTSGNLRMCGGTVVDGVNGDLILWVIEFSDRLVF